MESLYHQPIYFNNNSYVNKKLILEELNEKHTYCLKQNNFNPTKGSPNLFMTKLEFRMKNYYLEMELENDSFSLYQK